MTKEANIPQQYTHSVKIEDTAKGIRLVFTSNPYTHLREGDLGIVMDINECDYGDVHFTQLNSIRLT